MKKNSFLLLSTLLSVISISAQTTINGGNVSGTWTKANSPYKINDVITIPNGSTLTIEPGVKIEFAQFKYMKVDGRILATGGAGSTDSIWFTKQNTHDTGSWKGVKFIKTANTNDTSIFKYCVFRNCKSIYDTVLANRSGGITILNFTKVKISNSSFYRNEANIGASIFLTRFAYAIIKSCTFKNNSASRFWWFDGTYYNAYRVRGSAISVELGSSGVVDSCIFKGNKRGKDYAASPSILYDASTIDVEGSTFYKLNSYLTVKNSQFDGNEGVNFYAYNKAIVSVFNSNFANAPQNKTQNIIKCSNSNMTMDSCNILNNNSKVLLLSEENGNLNFKNGLIKGNYNHISYSDRNTSYLQIDNTKIINNNGGLDADGLIDGGIFANYVFNCLIANNNFASAYNGSNVVNSTIVNNRGSKTCVLAYNINCVNNIIWGNKCDSFAGKQIFNSSGGKNYYYNNIIENDTNTFGMLYPYTKVVKPTIYKDNLKSDPMFVNPTAGAGVGYDASLADFSLKNGCGGYSPAINKGKTDTLWLPPLKFDLAGNKRLYENNLDIGCYESVTGVPKISITKDVINDTLCEKSRSAELKLQAVGKGLAYQWQSSTDNGVNWSNINLQTANKLQISQTTPSGNSKLYRVIMTGTCDQDTSAVARVITNPLPVINLGIDTGVCKQNFVSRRVTENGTYLWHTGSKADSLRQRITKDSLWWVQITDAKGCMSSDSLHITAYNLPVVNLGADQSLDRQQQLTLNAGSHSSYLWSDGGNSATKTFFGKDLGPNGDYTIWVQVMNNQGCSSRDSIKITVTGQSGLNKISALGFNIYPQPAYNILNIDNANAASVYSIFTIDGKCLAKGQLQEGHNSISVADFANGLYVIAVYNPVTGKTDYVQWVKG